MTASLAKTPVNAKCLQILDQLCYEATSEVLFVGVLCKVCTITVHLSDLAEDTTRTPTKSRSVMVQLVGTVDPLMC